MEMWDAEIKKRWKEIPLDTYIFIFERGKEKFEEIISNGEIMTSRSMKLFYALIIFLSGIISIAAGKSGFVLKWDFCFVCLLFIADIYILLKLVKGRKEFARGTQPKDALTNILFEDGELTEDNKKSLAYYYEIMRVQHGIDVNKVSNKNRYKLYFSSFILTSGIFVYTAYLTLSIIFHLSQ